MTYEILLHRAAQRELDTLPQEALRTIDAAIWALRTNPRPFGIKKLEGDLHRIRLGPWRVIYAIYDGEHRVVILHVVRRSERTYKRLL